jgi:glutamine amidotransferase
MVPAHPEDLTAVCAYGPCVISAAVGRGSVHGFQFHPEKSGEFGLEMLRAFAEL